MTLDEILWVDPKRAHGAPLFRGTRVFAKALTDYLKAGYTLDEFLADFPGVSREQAEGLLDRYFEEVVAPLDRSEEAYAGSPRS